MLRATLDESTGAAARRRITGLLGSARSESDCPGLTNSGLFSSHYLFRTLPQEQRWEEARRRARPLLEMSGHTLIRGLGFKIQDRLAHALVLAAERDEQRAVAVLLDRNETFEAESARLGQSPAGYGLAVWIHTFVPGLPISTLDHNLVCADSLTGIGTLKEALDVLDPDRGERQMSIYSAPILEAMRSAVEPLAEQANALEADLSEVERGREQLREAKAKAEPAHLLFDAAVAVRLELADIPGSPTSHCCRTGSAGCSPYTHNTRSVSSVCGKAFGTARLCG